MTELYRGILTILNVSLAKLMDELRTHIRSFNKIYDKQGSEYDFGVLGFWNLMLEVAMNFYIIMCKFFGVLLVSVLAIVFYPLFAFMQVIGRSFTGIFAETKPLRQEPSFNDTTTPKSDKK